MVAPCLSLASFGPVQFSHHLCREIEVLCEPLDYDEFLSGLKQAYLVISDSGGVQEEATALGKPVLVLREQTERQEGVKAGALKLIGTDPDKIVREAERLLRNAGAYRKMSQAHRSCPAKLIPRKARP